MDSSVIAAAQALAHGDALRALKQMALRDDPPALALRGTAYAQLGDLERARDLLKRASHAFGSRNPTAQARCLVAEAEIALVSRDLAWPVERLDRARNVLSRCGDRVNAAHADCILARRLLLIGRLGQAGQVLSRIDGTLLPPAPLASYELAKAGIAIRRLDIQAACSSIARAENAARRAGIASLVAEVDAVRLVLARPAARLIQRGEGHILILEQVETLLSSDDFILDFCRTMVRSDGRIIGLGSRPVLLALLRSLAETWPQEATRDQLVKHGFRARQADESHRARLRVELGRLRQALDGVAEIKATKHGFKLIVPPGAEVLLLLPPVEVRHAEILALLADGEAWSSSAVALALGTSARSIQRAFEQLAADGHVQSRGQGRARRWMMPPIPGFPTTLLLPGSLPGG